MRKQSFHVFGVKIFLWGHQLLSLIVISRHWQRLQYILWCCTCRPKFRLTDPPCRNTNIIYIYVIQLRAPSKPCEIENNVGTVFLEVFLDWTYLRSPVYIRKRPGSPHPFSELPGAGMFSSKTLPKAPASRHLGFQSCCQKRRRTTGRNLDLSPRRHIFGSRFGEWLFI